MADVTGGIVATAMRYKDYWQKRSDWYWFWRLVQEVVELGLSLAGLHHDRPDHEIIQIGAIAHNWLSKRSIVTYSRPDRH